VRKAIQKEAPVDKCYYDASSLDRTLVALERRYGMPSREFYELHVAGELSAEISNFDRHVWASFYRDLCRMRGDDPCHVAEYVLEPA
jgi:hypothetical protein